MNIRCRIVEADLRSFQLHATLSHPTYRIALGGMLLVVLALTWSGHEAGTPVPERLLSLLRLCITIAVLTAVFLLLLRIARKLGFTSRFGALGDHTFEISDGALLETNPIGRIETRSSGILSIVETRKYFFVLTKVSTGHIIPKRCIEDIDAIRAELHALRSSAF